MSNPETGPISPRKEGLISFTEELTVRHKRRQRPLESDRLNPHISTLELGDVLHSLARAKTMDSIAALTEEANWVPSSQEVSFTPTNGFLRGLDIRERGMLAYKLGLLEQGTRVLEISNTESSKAKSLVITSRYPGNAAVVTPVLDTLLSDHTLPLNVFAITDGKAREHLEKKYPFKDLISGEETYKRGFMTSDFDVVVLDAASGDALSLLVDAQFSSGPLKKPKIIAIHDAHMSATRLHNALAKWQLRMPDKICVIDDGMKRMIVQKFPHLESRIIIIGDPAADETATPETVARMRGKVRPALELTDADTLVALLLREEAELLEIEAYANAFSKLPQNLKDRLYVTVRKHPRDNRGQEFASILESRGINLKDTSAFTTPEARTAADIGLGTLYGDGLRMVFSGIKTIHVMDPKFAITRRPNTDKEIPEANLGASKRLTDVTALTETMKDFMDSNSELSKSLIKKMAQHYPSDGKSAERAANVIRELLNQTEE